MPYDVLVIGGGPSGSTAANLLARSGAKVLVIEKDRFPRFHIGESLLPCDLELFERLGVDPSTSADNIVKSGADFVDEASGRQATYFFADSLGSGDHAYQVDRATFDLELLQRAEEVGAEVRQGEPVTDVELGRDRVVAVTARARYEGRYLVDATGMDALLARRHRSRRRIDDFGVAAVYRHFAITEQVAAELAETGNVKVYFIDDGWLWVIPLGGRRLSLGLVTRKKGIADAWLDEAIADSPDLTHFLEGAEPLGPPRRIGSFSFHNERPHGPRWVCIGDAACFLDPIFSSGVSLAMVGAEHAADILAPALADRREGEPGLMDGHAAHMVAGYNVFGTLIQALYQRRLLPDLFFTAEQDAELRRGMTSVLAGDVWRPDNRFQRILWQSARRRFLLPVPNGLADSSRD